MPTQQQKFDEKYVPEPNSGCWLWIGALTRKGYGKMLVDGMLRTTHRLSWQLHRGPIPDGLHVLHRCDVPSCVNPGHLFLGTNADNVADRVSKGRDGNHKGRANGQAKLSEEAVARIRADPRPGPALAAEYGVSNHTIWLVRRGMSWSHVGGEETPPEV